MFPRKKFRGWALLLLVLLLLLILGEPVTVSWSGDTRRNIIVWMDHRAVKQAERINASNSPVLQYFGGGVSPEMGPPKVQILVGKTAVYALDLSPE
ncbi:hypothetical protein BC332_09891 [Capsicum chinense]|uniref:Uncharacterized protein n=1 Tax=Capsicum annuum TaxID=4072 RepID=A0A2G3A3R4_CAPAN|nr:hypothetical protein FXO37_19933 [Capsicum annuum]PHT88872.1 hypothetical protein T459_10978 [Capsicum annuum]PHU24784.1 hypothetical protein BC332_09891 [Capsicum chinense]